MVVMNSQGVQSEDDIKGQPRPLPGRYHVVVKDVVPMLKREKEKDEKGDDAEKCEENEATRLDITFEVLAGTCPGQENRELTEKFYLSDKAMPRVQRLALAIGLLKPDQPTVDVPMTGGVGRQLIIEVEENSFTGKNGQEVKTVRLAFLGIWSLGNKAVADVPRSANAMQLLPGAHAAPASQAAAAPAAATSPAAATADKWADL